MTVLKVVTECVTIIVDCESVMIDITELKRNPIQPKSRDEQEAIGLAECIRQTKVIARILVAVSSDGSKYIVDGHRRVQAATLLKITKIPASIINDCERSPEELWCWLNRGISTVNSKHWLAVWASSKDRESLLKHAIPKSTARYIRSCIRIFGERRLIELGLSGHRSPSICNGVDIASRILRRFFDVPEERVIGEWLIAQKAQASIAVYHQHAPSSKSAAKRLLLAIENNQPCPTLNRRKPQ